MNTPEHYSHPTPPEPTTPPRAASPTGTPPNQHFAQHGDPSLHPRSLDAVDEPGPRTTTTWVLPSDLPRIGMRGVAAAVDRTIAAQNATARAAGRAAKTVAARTADRVRSAAEARRLAPPSSPSPSVADTHGLEL